MTWKFSLRTKPLQAFLQRERTTRHIHLWLHGFSIFSLPVKDSFQLSVTVLVRYRTRIIFRIRGYWPPYSCWIFNQQYSGYLISTFFFSPTGLSPSTALLSSRLQIRSWAERRSKPHICIGLHQRIRFVLIPFQSPLLRESRLLSFPADT